MPIINVAIKDKIARTVGGTEYICGNSDFVVIFDFDDEWNEYDNKTARFVRGGIFTDVVFNGNRCPVPVISDTHNIKVGVFAGNLRTTTPAYISAKKSILCGGGVPADPPDDVYNQIMNRIDEAIEPDPEIINAGVYAYLDEHLWNLVETDPTVPDWAKQLTKPTYTAEEVGADKAGAANAAMTAAVDLANMYTDKMIKKIPVPDASGQISEHDADKTAHNDIRLKLEGLEKDIADLMYKPISITSFAHNAGTKEMGAVVTSVTLSWAINKTPKTLTLDGDELNVRATSKILTGLAIKANKTFTLKAVDERQSEATKTTTIAFQNGVYYGAAAVPETIDSAFVIGLNKIISGTKNRTVNIAGGDGLYAFYAYPKRLGKSLFNIGGFDYEYAVETISFTNSFGYKEDYYVYRSGQYAPASLSVTVKDGG